MAPLQLLLSLEWARPTTVLLLVVHPGHKVAGGNTGAATTHAPARAIALHWLQEAGALGATSGLTAAQRAAATRRPFLLVLAAWIPIIAHWQAAPTTTLPQPVRAAQERVVNAQHSTPRATTPTSAVAPAPREAV